MSSEQVERLTPKQVLDKYRGEYEEPKTGWRDNRFLQDHPMKELYEALEASQQENDALKAELSKWKPRYAGFGDNEQEISNED